MDIKGPWGICQRSGGRYRLADLVQDGEYPGLLVHPRWREEQHPQEKSIKPKDDITVKRPSPERFSSGSTVVETFIDIRTGERYEYGVHLVIDGALNVEVCRPFCFSFSLGAAVNDAPAGVNPNDVTVRFSAQ